MVESRSLLLLSGCDGRRATLRATYRLQLGLGADARTTPAGSCRTCASSASATSTSRRCSRPARGSTHGYDVIDPRKVSDLLGGDAALRALCEEARDAGMGTVLDVVPNHMATDAENHFWRDPELRERFFDVDHETGRHRRFFDIDELAGVRGRGAGGLRDDCTATCSTSSRRGSSTGCASTTPTGSPIRAAISSGLRDEGVERIWVEKILEPGERLRDWPVEGTTGYEFLNDVQALFVDPAGEAALTELAGEGGVRRAAPTRRSSSRR